jgi:hypothetical protein
MFTPMARSRAGATSLTAGASERVIACIQDSEPGANRVVIND